MSQAQERWSGALGRRGSARFHSDWLAPQRYGFKLGDLGFLVPESCPGEIVRDAEICVIPYTKEWLIGVFNLRGNLIPVFDLQQMLSQKRVVAEKLSLLVLGKGRRAVAIVLESPPQLLTSLKPMNTYADQVPEMLREQVTAAYSADSNQIWFSFVPENFFTFLSDNAKLC